MDSETITTRTKTKKVLGSANAFKPDDDALCHIMISKCVVKANEAVLSLLPYLTRVTLDFVSLSLSPECHEPIAAIEDPISGSIVQS